MPALKRQLRITESSGSSFTHMRADRVVLRGAWSSARWEVHPCSPCSPPCPALPAPAALPAAHPNRPQKSSAGVSHNHYPAPVFQNTDVLLPHRKPPRRVWKWRRWSPGLGPAAPWCPASCRRSCQCCLKKNKQTMKWALILRIKSILAQERQKILRPYMSLWTFSRARAAKPMFFRTSVLVCEFSKASRWNSMVDSVPSIWTSCCSRRFFFFKARRAAGVERSPRGYVSPASPLGGELPGLGIQRTTYRFLPTFIFSLMWLKKQCRISMFIIVKPWGMS